jgi:type IV fimbrial biogenesis protein FimT
MLKNLKGVSLLELLTTMAIIAILCCVAIPSYNYIITENRADTAIVQLYRAIQLARSEAIKRNCMVVICPTVDGRQCAKNWHDGYMIFADYNANGMIEAKDQIIKTFSAIKTHGTLDWRSFPRRNSLQFTSLGFTNYQNGTFYYYANSKNPALTRTLIISKTGRARFGKNST